MKRPLTILILSVGGLLAAAIPYAQQAGPAAPLQSPLHATDVSQTLRFNVQPEQVGDQFFGTSLKGDTLTTILDEIQDGSERKAFADLFEKRAPEDRREHAEKFLRQYPQSAFLAEAYEFAAKASIDLGDDKAALEYGRGALELLPENPLLLVPIANVQAGTACWTKPPRMLSWRSTVWNVS